MWLYIVVLAISPITDGRPILTIVMDLVLYVSLLIGASYMATAWIMRVLVYPLAALWLLAHVVQLFLGKPYLVSPYIGLALACAVIWGILSRFSTKIRTESNPIAEAVICYLVIAGAFSDLYWIMNHQFNNCFDRPIAANRPSAFLYFSLTTLTTLGSGDIQPVNHYVRFVAAFESVAGIFYLAIVIARLVADYRADAGDKQVG